MLTVKRLSLADARTLIEGATKQANEIGVPMCISISDDSGNLIAFERMDSAKAHSIQISQDKAFTSGASRKATSDYNKANQPGQLAFGIHAAHNGRMSTVGGGFPVMHGDDCVGGIGVSGGLPAQDMEVAEAGISHFLSKLE